MLNNILILITVFIFFYIFPYIYIYIWKRYSKNNKKITPSGYGFILSILAFSYFIINHDLLPILNILILILILNFIYWLDDLIEVNFKIRILIQLITSVLLIFLIKLQFNYVEINFLTIFFFISIFPLLINFINFYDGADLNLSSLIIVNVLILFLSKNLNGDFFNFLVFIFLFFLGFSFINYIPKKLYLGDSGAFVISILYTVYIIYYISTKDFENLIYITPLFFVFIDCTFVIILRLFRKENLLTRNYLHIYQRIQIINQSKIYLLPLVINSAFILFVILLYQNLFINLIYSFLIIFLFSSLFYFYIHFLLIYYEKKF